MNFQDELERGHRRRADDEPGGGSEPKKPRKKKGQPTAVGDALRSIYDRAVEEDIPPEMLDLLGKLG